MSDSYPLLDKVNLPSDLKILGNDDLIALSEDVRRFIIDSVSKTGGHLAANLGVVELTIALLKVFNLPTDKIVWDVSHQAYAYKILTGRKARFHTLRQMEGLSGFTKRDESEYDCFGAGHSGTAISAALGLCAARDRLATGENVVAVVGDASAGCGISLEAFNNISSTTKRLIVILNDNKMSIGANVGSVARHLGELLANPEYNRWKHAVESFAQKMKLGFFRNTYYKIEEAIKSMFLKSAIFEEFGLRYIGPVDGHNLPVLMKALSIARDSDRPILLHVVTQKGRGYSFAEEAPEKWHGTLGFDVDSGEPLASTQNISYSAVLGKTLQELSEKDDRIVAITAAMCSGTGLSGFAKKYPERFHDVGISEEHAVVFAAGLAASGMKPVFAVYSTFAQRAVDCIIHDVCLQNLPVVICLDRAGIVGDDGPTHHGVFDIPLLSCVPNLVFMQPSNGRELYDMLSAAFRFECPVIIRYPRGDAGSESKSDLVSDIELGKAVIVRPGTQAQIWALGDMIPIALAASDLLSKRGISAGVVNPRFIRPIDEKLLLEQIGQKQLICTIENGVISGGFGCAVQDIVSRVSSSQVLKFGWPNTFVVHGHRDALLKRYNITAIDITEAIASRIS